jgi:hypothetical protein
MTPAAPASTTKETAFSANEVRLNARQWIITCVIVVLVTLLLPRLWERIERFETGPEYRIPYEFSKDYWLYGRWLRQATNPERIVVLGDSVIWGEYVLPEGTLSHFLNREAGKTDRFINGGVNGTFPLALEGLINYYGQSIRRQKVIIHCNALWMTSPKADLSTDKEEPFNHAPLVSQLFPRIPCYKAGANERLSAIVERQCNFMSWLAHLQIVYFDQKSIPNWTLAEDGGSPPRYPNAWKNPLAQITLRVPSAPDEDPQRGPKSPRHKSWSDNPQGTTRFEWVDLEASLQWSAFRRAVKILQDRGNDVLVLVGPFNEHLMTAENRLVYRKLRSGIADWLSHNRIAHVLPETLPSVLYADASHPLTEGYELLARCLYGNASFTEWINKPMNR